MVNALIPQEEESPQRQFCALEYRPQGAEIIEPPVASVILLVLRDGEGNLKLMVHPELRRIVLRADTALLETLIQDFIERAKLHPEQLFKHLSSLGVGPLVTKEVGSSLSDHPHLMELRTQFVELW